MDNPCTRVNHFGLAALVALFTTAALIAINAQSHGADAPRSRQAFERTFTTAFDSGELRMDLPLFYWKGVTRRSRAIIVSLIERNLSRRLQRLSWLPPGPKPDRATMRSNLPVNAGLSAQFEDAHGVQSLSVHDIGTKDGVYYIVLVEPTPIGA